MFIKIGNELPISRKNGKIGSSFPIFRKEWIKNEIPLFRKVIYLTDHGVSNLYEFKQKNDLLIQLVLPHLEKVHQD